MTGNGCHGFSSDTYINLLVPFAGSFRSALEQTCIFLFRVSLFKYGLIKRSICDPSVHNEPHVGKIQYGVYDTIG